MGKKRKGQPTTAQDVLQGLLENNNNPLADQFTRWKLWKKWKDIVGATISNNSMPVGYYRGTLYVWVKSSVWLQEFVFIAGPLKEKINLSLGRKWISNVRFTLNKHDVPNFTASLAEETILK